MDYTDPANRRLRDEPTLPLSPEEAQIAAALYSANTVAAFQSWLAGGCKPGGFNPIPGSSTPNTTTHEKETDPRNN